MQSTNSIARARQLRRNSTDAESALWRLLRSSGSKFRRQHPMGPYIADFVCLNRRLIVECDGGQHAESTADEARDKWFAARRFRTFRFWNHDILNDQDGVVQTILSALTEASPTRGEGNQTPSPPAGEGWGEG